ncbi:hypothetical protein VNI00_000245 [Paramarasmius palmivorus]|uniref:Hpc2-related domain-containing protein n=1 Tax=Paramarasmius palmivorus TaxID=297713 RepID=A0AAW0EC70_9AGAR
MDESKSTVLAQETSSVDVVVNNVSKPPSSLSPPSDALPPTSNSPHDDQKPRSSLPPPPQSSSSKPHSTAKPKSRAAPPPRSPSPPPPPPPTLTTVRLQIKLNGPEDYQVDIAALARETGQRPPTPVQKRADTSESEEEDDAKNTNTAAEKPKSKKKKKNAGSEYYDVSDPFIDDSELALDERTYFAQTKQSGFYVSSGEVALMKDNKSPVKKPKSRRPPLTVQPTPNGDSASASASVKREGTKDSPIALISDSETEAGPKGQAKSKAEHQNGQEPYPFFSGPTLGQALAGVSPGPAQA